MDTTIIVCLITCIFSLVTTIVTLVVKRRENKQVHDWEKEEKLEALNNTYLDRLLADEKEIKGIKRDINKVASSLNEVVEVQTFMVNGLGLVIDAMEVGGMNGEGRDYLDKINSYYMKKGKESMQFQCFNGNKENV